jgi:hypothetical protein
VTDQDLDYERGQALKVLADAYRFEKITAAEWHAAMCRELELSRVKKLVDEGLAVIAELKHRE